jgi:hypothetical protein
MAQEALKLVNNERRQFIGGSDAWIIMGNDRLYCGCGVRNAARSSQKTCHAISSCSSVEPRRS